MIETAEEYVLDQLPRREPGRTQIPCPRYRLLQEPAPDITALTRFADTLREWRPHAESRQPR
ncbi:hypothetical protein C5F51_09395 [Nocardia nova]|uniref:Uncharacterized protein n=1 Tax=Nocardia nova TaxID=37330 RepID=A0A2S6AAW1_9NOCA|nr:hypothetical protein C5F51_09395 [Nocardia nova]